MTATAGNFAFHDLVQLQLDKQYGEGKCKATDLGVIKYTYSESHHGSNEIVCGSWSVLKRALRIYVYLDYDKGLEAIKTNTKPQGGPVSINLGNILKGGAT